MCISLLFVIKTYELLVVQTNCFIETFPFNAEWEINENFQELQFAILEGNLKNTPYT